MTVNAVNPEEAYSPEHWLNSFGLATLLASGGLSAASNQILTKPILTQPKPAATIPKGQQTTKTQLIPSRTDYIKGKMDKALEQIGKVKVPVLVKEELATEFGSLSMMRMETKRFQETQLQLFKGRGDGNKVTSNVNPEVIRKVDNDILDRMESLGGHTIDRHVGKTNEELIKRAIQQNVEAATSFTDKSTAIKAIQENLRKNANNIAEWINNSDTGRKVFDVSHKNSIGKGALEDKKQIIYDLTNSRVVLIRDTSSELGFRILTSFPVDK
ncbi:RNase A-like domain-containing protein [Gracilibacillus saliphilus]|uniref:RNase A-like domain-containing protein n=1 Tax=Gracilibacillus saliphilus TaxID=543890 RepID=UPI00192DD423|nr:RNase A-like domain-containing protein [Gracilibacillus saliphilus]